MIEPNNTTPGQNPTAGENKSPEPVSTPMDQLWVTSQVAHYMQVSPKTVFNRRMNDGLPYSLIGGAVRYEPEKVKAYVASHSNLVRHRRRQIVRKGGKV